MLDQSERVALGIPKLMRMKKKRMKKLAYAIF